MTNAIDDLPLPLYGDGLQRRDWLYVLGPRAARSTPCCATARAGETYNVPGSAPRWTNRDDRRARCSSGSASRGRSSGASRTGRPRPPLRARRLRSSRRSAGATGRRSPTGLAATVDWFVANEAWWRAAKSRRLGRLLRAPVRRPARRLHRGLSRCASRSPARADGWVGRLVDGPRGVAVHRTVRPRSAGPAAIFDLDPARRVRHAARPRPARGRRPCRRLDGRRRLRPRPGARARPERDARPRPSPRPTAARGIDLVRGHRRTRCSTAGGPTGPGTRPTTRRTRINPYGASKLAGEARRRDGHGRCAATGRARALGIVRTAWLFGPPGNDFPAQDPRRRGPGARPPASRSARRRRRVRRADVQPRHSPEAIVGAARRCRDVAGIAPRRQRRGRQSRARMRARETAPPGRASRSRSRKCPPPTWPRASTPPAWASSPRHAAARRRAAAAVAGGAGCRPYLRERSRPARVEPVIRADLERPTSAIRPASAIGAIARHGGQPRRVPRAWRASALPAVI